MNSTLQKFHSCKMTDKGPETFSIDLKHSFNFSLNFCKKLNPDWKVCLARPVSLPHTLNFSCGSSCEIFIKQQKETIEPLFSNTNTV